MPRGPRGPRHGGPIRLGTGQRGATWIEICVACVIVGTLSAIAVPSFSRSMERHQVEGVAAQFESDVQFARAAAHSRSASLRLDFQYSAAGACYVLHTGGAGDCRCDATGRAACEADVDALRTSFLPADGRVQMRSNVRSMVFNGHRNTVTPAGSVNVTGRNGAALRSVVNVLGRVRACSPLRSVPGYRPC